MSYPEPVNVLDLVDELRKRGATHVDVQCGIHHVIADFPAGAEENQSTNKQQPEAPPKRYPGGRLVDRVVAAADSK